MTPLTWTLSVSVQMLLSLFSTCNASRPTYIITAPRRVFPRLNMTFTVCPLQDSQPPLRITAQISKDGQNLSSAEGTFPQGTIGTLILPTEGLSVSHYQLAVQGYAEQRLLFSNWIDVEVVTETVSSLIQTDKAIYKPGQTVKIRAICIYPDLKPYLGKISVIIRSPRKSVIQQWLDLETTLGVISKEFPLSPNSLLGNWYIQVTSNGLQKEKTFTVAEYVLSRFEVLINTPSVYLPLDRMSITGTVTGRYLYGKPVKGNVTVTISFPHISSTINKTLETNGTAHFIIPSTELQEFFLNMCARLFGLSDSFLANQSFELLMNNTFELHKNYAFSMRIKAAVTESLTGVTQSTDVNVTVSFLKYKLEILKHQQTLKPPLNFTANLNGLNASLVHFKVQVSRIDHRKLTAQDRENTLIVHVTQTSNQPSDSNPAFATEQLEYNRLVSNAWSTSYTFKITVPESGFVKIQFPLLPNTVHLSMKITFEKMTKYISVNSNVHLSRTPFIQLQMESSLVKVGLPFEFAIESSEVLNETNYQVVSRGQVVFAGKSQLTTVELTPELSWAPSASLIAYYITEDGQIVSDALDLNVEGIFANKVSLSWSKDQVKPADNVSLSVSTSEDQSFIGVLVVDKGVQLLKGGNDLTEAMIIQELKGAAKDNIASANGWYPDFNVFQDNGLIVLTDASIPYIELLYIPQMMAEVDYKITSSSDKQNQEEHKVRMYFPETWIWLDMFTGSSSTVTLQRTVPDSLTTWIASAFAISKNQGLQLAMTPAELEVFKSFFLEMNLPYSITRGEQLILEINIFNYLQQTLEVWVTVEMNDLFDFVIIPDEKDSAPNRQKGSVLSQDSHVFYFPIKLKGLGKIPVTVKAMSEVAFDSVTKYILVKAEGIQQSFSQSLFVAPKAGGQLWSKEVEFTFPDNVVNGSEIAHVTVIGDILGPSINGLEDLLQMPYGCGEQNMIRFAPNVYILQYFTAINQVNEEIKEKALSYMIQGYQRELTYQRSDGSFSAFGNSDSSGSTWLSAFVLRCFLQAQSFIYIDTSLLDETIYWIMKHQDEIGEFSEPGRVIHSELQGGQSGPISLTAYILTALLEDQSYLHKVLSQVSDSVTYLEDKLQNGISSNYTLSLVTYALTLANSSFATQALDELNRRADEKDGVKFWSSPIKRGSTWWSQQPLSSDIEVAAYALLSHLRQGRLLEGIPIMQWLSECRNHLGGFSSTQDTVVALQALSQFAAQSFSPTTSLTVTVSGPGLPTPAVFSITSKNAIVLQTRQIGIQQPMLVTVTAQGQGLAIFQLNILFNLESKVASKRRRSVESQEVFDLDVDILDDKDDLDHVTLHICTRYRGGENSSITGMVLMEVGMLSGFVPEMEGVQTNDLIKKVEFEAGKVNLYFDSLNETEVCVTIPVIRDSKVAHAQDAVVSMFEYYEPGRRAVRTYKSKVMSDIDSCTFCGFNCSLCWSQFGAVSVPSAALPTLGEQIPLTLCLLGTYLNLS
ncbi:CD109 antigen [Carcharodon carcharias]|uniref:CD109 antigen n=1 Tax=Carcharodon carcharias TaxID=13397 RepID=UPI001B7F13D2|nr:CD109 antigen [Carcharodon carcharias]